MPAATKPNLFKIIGKALGDLNLRLYERGNEPFRVPSGTTTQPIPWAPGLTLNIVPGMGQEGHAVGRNVYVGPEADMARIFHEIQHTEQMRRWGSLYDPVYKLLAQWLTRQGRPSYMEHPFEKEAMAVEQQAHAATRKSRGGR